MSIPFSELPGRHERHYRRRLGNPLFGVHRASGGDAELLEMQRLDHEELLGFLDELRATVHRAMNLRPNEGSEVILEIKERLDRLYETSAGLAEDHAANRAAIAQLIEVIMRNVERGAAGDVQAAEELVQERAARAAHYELLRWPLIADLLHPHSAIVAEDLAPTLLSADAAELDAALGLFDAGQLAALYADAARLLEGRADAPTTAAARLEQIARRLSRLRPLN
ncbi:MAG: hypothetical protein H6959_08925 [Chromatiaceae bacterium]|nr:hypothetical protein [Gammaproteobacteria bacterium]MCP5301468.1 hypothetical protein [Chromatiaceae bacterium]MCP5423032.1 hypothetical protein [Chromatiaceae bacterium]